MEQFAGSARINGDPTLAVVVAVAVGNLPSNSRTTRGTRRARRIMPRAREFKISPSTHVRLRASRVSFFFPPRLSLRAPLCLSSSLFSTKSYTPCRLTLVYTHVHSHLHTHTHARTTQRFRHTRPCLYVRTSLHVCSRAIYRLRGRGWGLA